MPPYRQAQVAVQLVEAVQVQQVRPVERKAREGGELELLPMPRWWEQGWARGWWGRSTFTLY